MPNAQTPVDPRWDRLLALAVHEFRTPVTVVAGYISMLLKDRAGPLNDQQRRLLEESQKSTAKLSALILEMSDLASIEEGKQKFNRARADFGSLLTAAIAALPPVADREVTVMLENDAPGAAVQAEPEHLKTAVTSVLFALRRELVTSAEMFVRLRRATHEGRPVLRLSIGDADHIDMVESAAADTLDSFDEWRGGCGLSLALARRIINRHDGSVWSPAEDPKAGAVIVLPEG